MREGYKHTELGEIPEKWNVDLLGEVAERYSGHTPNKQILENWNGEIPWISLKDTNKLDNRLIYKTEDYTSETGIKNSSAVLLPRGTVVISRDATVGKIGIMGREMATSQHFINYVCKEKLSNIYLYYYLLSIKGLFQRIAIGSTIKTIGLPFFKELKIVLPPIPEQQKIADILSTVDEHIEEIEKIIETTKTLKKGLMQRLLTKGIGGHTEFKDTEIGKIPKSWEVKNLEEIVIICYGKSQKEVENDNGKYKILGTGGVMGYTDSFLWDKPSVLIGRKGTIDKPQYIEEPFWTVDTLFYTKFKSEDNVKWLYYYLNYIDLKQYNEATGVPSLSTSILNKIKLPVPSIEEQVKISAILNSVDENIDIYELKKEKLLEVKKALMQNLLTGRIRVRS